MNGRDGQEFDDEYRIGKALHESQKVQRSNDIFNLILAHATECDVRPRQHLHETKFR